MLCVKYYEYAVKYCLNKADKVELETAFKDVLGLDIDQLAQKISPLGFKFKYTDDLPQANKSIEEALKEDEKNLRNEAFKDNASQENEQDYEEQDIDVTENTGANDKVIADESK